MKTIRARRVAAILAAGLLMSGSSAFAQCLCSTSIEPIPSLENLVIFPGSNTTANLFIDNDGTVGCTYNWALAQTAGPAATLSPTSGQLVVGRFGSARVPFTVTVPADVTAREAVRLQATATINETGAKCQAQHWVNIIPRDEQTEPQGWLNANPTVHIFGQRLLPLTAPFRGRTVYNAYPHPGEGVDTCHRTGDPFSPYIAEIKAPNIVGLFNEFGDVVGYTRDQVEYFRMRGRIPCGTEFTQYMAINCTIINPCIYTTNTLKANMPDGGTVYVERDGVGVSRSWPPLGPGLPGPPTNFTVNVNGLALTLSWFAPTGTVISSYRIEAGTLPAVWNLADFDTGSTATMFSAPSVPPGTYFVRVRAVNPVGRSVPSNEVTFTVGGGAAAPNAPTGLSSTVADRTVVLNWSAPAGGGAATTYVIEAGSSSGASNFVNFATGGLATSYTATGVAPGTYFVRVRARNAFGTSAASQDAIVTVAAPAAPGAPAGLQATVNGSVVVLTWTAPAGGGAPTTYVVEAGSAPGVANLANLVTNGTVTQLTASAPRGTYFVRVRARNLAGTGAASNEVTVIVP